MQRHGFDLWIGKITLEEEMATHCSLLARIIPWAKEPGMLYSPWGHKEADKTEAAQHAGTEV